ncbi:hypothetical protein A3J32_02775 [Candidatus Saccharibacteria bacterium RIFCSPLOWO2_02_FULL_46_7]|nr:MAG: hypothetical protein A3J32_02775 [Candidatus Saccharibacteria bacterium RIFCSPLOWO2_02_FULL_46_7]
MELKVKKEFIVIMEFISRGRQNVHPAAGQPSGKRGGFMGRLMRIEIFTVILGSALLLAAVALYLGFSGGVGSESKKINDKQYQAVFLNNGQVYFGKIKGLNNKFVDLTNVFYIENNASSASTTQSQSTNYTLRKLGTTELHSPEDEMIINREQVTFWENLKDTSQVVTKIKEYYQNPSSNTQTNTPSTQNQNTTSPQNTSQ